MSEHHPVAAVRVWGRSWRGPMTLRRRLVLSIVALAVGLSVVLGLVSVLVLHRVLANQLDQQVGPTLSRAIAQIPGLEGAGGQMPSNGDFRGQGQGTISIISSGNRVLDSSYVSGASTQKLSAAAGRTLADVKPMSELETVDLGGKYGQYRVKAQSFQVTGSGRTLTFEVVAGLPTTSVTGPVRSLIAGIVIIAALGIAVSIAFAMLTVRYALGPLQRMAATASRVADMPLDRGEVALDARVAEEDTDPRTEVGRVGFAMNRMLGHVSHALTARQQSENKVRQFVADASHELRTPLASVRGYAELTRRMGKDLPEDVVYAMGRIESEAVRMTSLVEELLLLARLDEGTDLVKKEVDLTRIVLDAVHDTHVSTTGHQFEVSVPEAPITLLGDPMRLHQVVANLLNNTRTHTPEGTEVWVTLARDEADHEAVVTVSDNGPGIDPAVMPVLFERFARADSSRSRKAGSTGLGLAIVQAVVHSHGGTVTAANAEPGAVFTVRLPLEPAPTGEPIPLPAPEPVRP